MKRRLTVVCAALATAGLLVLGTASAWAAAGPGQNPTPAACLTPPVGSPCVVVSGTSDHASTPIRTGDTVHYTFTLANTGDTDGGAADVLLHLDNDLQYVDGSAEVNGHPVAIVFTAGRPDITDAFLVPAHGSATVTFAAEVLAPLDGGPTAQTTYVRVSGIETSNDVVVSPPVTDLAVFDSLNEPVHTHPANPGQPADLDVEVQNRGTGSPSSTLQVAVPSGWTVRPNPAFHITCTQAGSVVSCPIAALAAGAVQGLQLWATPGRNAALGAVRSIPVTVTPTGAADEFPADNSFSWAVVNAGEADLTMSVTPSATKVVKNGLVSFTVAVTNRGPNPSVNARLALYVDTQTTNAFTQLRPTGPGQVTDGGSASALKAGPPFDWAPGTIAVGQTVTLTVRWRANVLGSSGKLEANLAEDPYNAHINLGQIEQVESAAVSVVATLPATGAGVSSESGSAGSGLAATGASTGAPIGWGVGLIAAGGLLLAGTRRRAGR